MSLAEAFFPRCSCPKSGEVNNINRAITTKNTNGMVDGFGLVLENMQLLPAAEMVAFFPMVHIFCKEYKGLRFEEIFALLNNFQLCKGV
jgi:hypothetical protein